MRPLGTLGVIALVLLLPAAAGLTAVDVPHATVDPVDPGDLPDAPDAPPADPLEPGAPDAAPGAPPAAPAVRDQVPAPCATGVNDAAGPVAALVRATVPRATDAGAGLPGDATPGDALERVPRPTVGAAGPVVGIPPAGPGVEASEDAVPGLPPDALETPDAPKPRAPDPDATGARPEGADALRACVGDTRNAHTPEAPSADGATAAARDDVTDAVPRERLDEARAAPAVIAAHVVPEEDSSRPTPASRATGMRVFAPASSPPAAVDAAPVPARNESVVTRDASPATPAASPRDAEPKRPAAPEPTDPAPATGSYAVAASASEPGVSRDAATAGGALLTIARGTLAVAVVLVIPTLLAWALYHRVRGAATLKSPARRAMLERVNREPGVTVQALADAAGVTYTTACYHLKRLESEGFLVAERASGALRYYRTGGGFTARERAVHQILRNPKAMRVLACVKRNPGTHRNAVAATLGLSATAVNWHLKRLRAAGLVSAERRGRRNVLRVDDASLAAARSRLEARG